MISFLYRLASGKVTDLRNPACILLIWEAKEGDLYATIWSALWSCSQEETHLGKYVNPMEVNHSCACVVVVHYAVNLAGEMEYIEQKELPKEITSIEMVITSVLTNS